MLFVGKFKNNFSDLSQSKNSFFSADKSGNEYKIPERDLKADTKRIMNQLVLFQEKAEICFFKFMLRIIF